MNGHTYIGERTNEILSQFIDTNKFMDVDFRVVVGKFGAYSFVPELSGADCEDTREVLYALIDTIKDEMLNNFEDFMYAATAYCMFKKLHPELIRKVDRQYISATGTVINFVIKGSPKKMKFAMTSKAVKQFLNEAA